MQIKGKEMSSPVTILYIGCCDTTVPIARFLLLLFEYIGASLAEISKIDQPNGVGFE